MLSIQAKVAMDGRYNFVGCRIPLPTNLNIAAWRAMAVGYEDQQVIDFLEFGFPASYSGPIPDSTYTNHASARQHPQHIAKYVAKEVAEGAMLGPHSAPMFAPWSQVNPLLTRPKKDTTDRRVIVDLSFPHSPPQQRQRRHTNRGVPAGATQAKAALGSRPIQLIREGGKGCLLHSLDIA